MCSDEEIRVMVHGTSEDRSMLVKGRLHKNGRLKENMSRECKGDRNLTVDGTNRDMNTTSEHMVKCKYIDKIYCIYVICEVYMF